MSRYNKAEELKNAGNQHYLNKELSDALSSYAEGIVMLTEKKSATEALELIEKCSGPLDAPELCLENLIEKHGILGAKGGVEDTVAGIKLLTILFSNSSQILFDQKEYQKSERFAYAAASLDPKNVKAWFRMTRAQSANGQDFAAFITLHHRLLPVLRESTKPSERPALLDGIDERVYEGAMLSRVSDAFGIVRHAEGGGLGAVALTKMKENVEIFMEQMVENDYVMPDRNLFNTSHVSHEVVFLHFASQLVKAYEDDVEDGKEPGAWKSIVDMLEGSWPRCPEDIPERVLESGKTNFEKKFPDFCARHTEDVKILMVHKALVCRYNCFHAGFFRASALLNHSCTPNAAMKQDKQNNTHLMSVKPIAQGDALTVKYLTDLEFLFGAGRRRELLHNSWLFWCDCERCASDTDAEKPDPAEMVICGHNGCTELIHLPMPGRSEPPLDDPLIPKSRKCPKCGHIREWSDETLKKLFNIVDLCTSPNEQHITQLAAATVEYRRAVREWVGPQHWLIRVILYLYCSSMLSIIENFWVKFVQRVVLGEDCARELLRHFGWSTDRSAKNGGDVLQCFRELWSLIQDFYPSNQAWMLHLSIARLVVWSIVTPQHPTALPFDESMAVLVDHAKYLGDQERHFMFRIISERANEAKLSSKQMNSLKKCLNK